MLVALKKMKRSQEEKSTQQEQRVPMKGHSTPDAGLLLMSTKKPLKGFNKGGNSSEFCFEKIIPAEVRTD